MVVTGRRRAVSALVSASCVCGCTFNFGFFPARLLGGLRILRMRRISGAAPLPAARDYRVCSLASAGYGLGDQLGKVPGKTVPGGDGGPVGNKQTQATLPAVPSSPAGGKLEKKDPCPRLPAAR